MRVNLFGVGLKGKSPAITAQSRVNCYVEQQQEADRTNIALIGTAGLILFSDLGASPSRGMWTTGNTLWSVHANTLFSIDNAGVATNIGTIGTTMGNVSMADDGTYLVIVDGTSGYYYNYAVPGAITQIVDPNFPTRPTTVTWQDTYFIVNKGQSNQFSLSNNADPSTWPAVNINFTGSAPGAIQAVLADHSILPIFGDVYTEFWQDTGAADFPYSPIPGSAQEFGLASPWSLCKYDNSLAGLFKNKMGEVNISRLSGFRLQQLSSFELDSIINDRSIYTTVSDAVAYGYMLGGHPMYQISFPTVGKTWEYDGASRVWSERKATDGTRYWGQKFANFLDQLIVSDYRNGKLYKVSTSTYADDGSMMPMEVTSKHIWNDDKFIGISRVQVDVQSGVGITLGQGSNPQIDLQVSKDGGNTFTSVGFSSLGAIGKYTQRVVWDRLGAARDWVLRLRITDPVKRVITGASAEIVGGAF